MSYGFSTGISRTYTRNQSGERHYRVKCEACKKQTTAHMGVCDSCGEYPGIVSSYAACPHDPVHTWKERGTCIKQSAKGRKRVRRVVDSGEVPHLWYHKVQDSAKNAKGSLYFEGDTIYSYGSHFPIARHIQSGKRTAVLFTTQSYSVTTSGHCSAVRSAIPESVQVFEVRRVFTEDRYASNPHAENLKDYADRVSDHLAKCARARQSFSKEYGHRRATELRTEAREYAKFFRLPMPKISPIPALDSKQLEEIKQREAQTAAKKAEATRLEKIERAKREAELADKWRKGEYDGGLYNLPVMLRLTSDKSEVETSRGARVPVSHALRGLRFVRAVVARGEAFETNGKTFHLGHYKIDRIGTDGTLTAGCHVISFAEIERIAPELERIASAEDVPA
jgi:hypothetical protein